VWVQAVHIAEVYELQFASDQKLKVRVVYIWVLIHTESELRLPKSEEARIRRQLVSRHSVQLLIHAFGGWEVTEYTEIRKIFKHNRKCTYRSRVFENGTSETICKSSTSREDVNDAWCAVHVSVEAPVPSMQRALLTIQQAGRLLRWHHLLQQRLHLPSGTAVPRVLPLHCQVRMHKI
jgi:hypothetical protein